MASGSKPQPQEHFSALALENPPSEQRQPLYDPTLSQGSSQLPRPQFTTQSHFHGAGVQHSGPGSFTVHGDMNIGVRDLKPERKPVSTVPFSRDPDFVDRPGLLEWIRDRYKQPAARAALVGLGGVGKSQIAIQFCYTIRDECPETWVFWVHASTKSRFEEAYRGLADRLLLPDRNNPETNIFQLVYNWLCDEENGRWLMVLDNVDDNEVFFPKPTEAGKSSATPFANYLPQCDHGFILLTSRNKDAATRLVGGVHIQEVRVMGEPQALQLLERKLPNASSQNGAENLVRALEYIPLAITQAAAYIRKRDRMTVNRYLDEFQKSDKKKQSLLNRELGDLRRDADVSNSVVITWQMSFERIRSLRPSAADLLALMSQFNPQGIPEWILQSYTRTTGQRPPTTQLTKSDSESDNDEYDDDIDVLQDFHLVARTNHEMFEMHALVQFCTQLWLSAFYNLQEWKNKFLTLMSSKFPPGKYENWRVCQQLLPHLEPILNHAFVDDEDIYSMVELYTNAAWYIQLKGDYTAAYDIAKKAVDGSHKVFGDNHMSTFRSVSLVAGILNDQGKYEEAEKMNRRALEGLEKELGPQHINTLASVNTLALVLQFRGKYEEAEEMSRRALKGLEKKLGPQHINTLTSVNNLAWVLQFRGKYEEAEEMSRRALEGFEKKLGPQHPDTLTSVNTLAVMLGYRGKYEEAEEMSRRALEGLEKELGPQHINTLTSVNNLAVMLKARGKYEEAEKMNRRALERREKELGRSIQTP